MSVLASKDLSSVADHGTESSNSMGELELVAEGSVKPVSDSVISHGPIGNTVSSGTCSITEEEIWKIREDLHKSLQEEKLLNSQQMQLTMQLDNLKASIATAESEERLANLAIQQAKVIRRMKKAQDPDADVDDEEITIVSHS